MIMRKAKKVIAFCLSTIMLYTTVTIAYAADDNASDIQNTNYSMVFEVEKDSLDNVAEEYNIPKEVSKYIADVFSENKEAKVTVYSPESKISMFGSSGSWSNTRTYKGYTLKDWNVHVTNSFGMVDIKTGSLSAKFANELLIYGAGNLLDRIVPFGSAGITLAQFILGNSSSVTAKSGDKASAAPRYTSDTKFTYVKVGVDYLLGARTHKALLQDITWHYYSDSLHKPFYGLYTYNRTFKTPSYNSPDAKAITGTGIGGILESAIKVRIGSKDFVLE